MTDPVISVVLPTYNHLRFLPPAITDIYCQTRTDWELIVVNDGSTDGTAAWLDTQRHKQLRVIHQDNLGAAEAINTGIRAARGEYVTWVSADNRCASYFLEALAVPLDLDPECTLSYSPYFGIDMTDRIFALKFDNVLLLRELISNTPRGNAGFLYRRAVHDRVGMYAGWVCDTLMWSRIVDGGSSVFVIEPTYYYRFHDDRATLRRRADVDAARPDIMAEFLARHGGQIRVEELQRLYPGLARAPGYLVDAATDFSFRMVAAGIPHRAFDLQLAVLASGDAATLFRPLAAFIVCAHREKVDPLLHIAQALAANHSLSAAQKAVMQQTASALDAAVRAGITVPMQTLEANHPLLALEKPKLFSFCAWREQRGLGAVPPVSAF
jgi:glycosyltransferase involved in cell wall biosynthesis